MLNCEHESRPLLAGKRLPHVFLICLKFVACHELPSSDVTQLLATIDAKMAGIGHVQEARPSSNPSFTPDVEAYRHLFLASPLYTIHTAGCH